MISTDEPISTTQWEFVQQLLHDLQAEENREEIASHFGQWTLSIKTFRRVETHRMTLMEPTKLDLLFHRACITDLISFGSLLEIAADEHGDGDLAQHGVRRDAIKALIADLQDTYDEWHGQVPETRIAELTRKIFDAAPELNLPNSRA